MDVFFKCILQVITDYVYNLLEARGMIKLPLPVDAPLGSGTFIYSSTRELCRPEKLMILIHGSGVVRAGQWSRRYSIPFLFEEYNA